MNDDSKIWEDSLKDKNNIDLFKTKPGGGAKALPKKDIFKTPKQKKIEDRIDKLEKMVDEIIKEIRKVKHEIKNK